MPLRATVAAGNAARSASDSQAEGIGLYRTELSSLSASEEPTVDEQARIYAKVFNAFPESRVRTTTFDSGKALKTLA